MFKNAQFVAKHIKCFFLRKNEEILRKTRKKTEKYIFQSYKTFFLHLQNQHFWRKLQISEVTQKNLL